MRLRELSLKNFRCFADLTINLDRDLTLIFGVNGAGKTTLVDALGLGLSVLPGLGEARGLVPDDLRLMTTRVRGAWAREYLDQVEVALSLERPSLSWIWSLKRGARVELHGRASALQRQTQRSVDDANAVLPVFALYRADRSWRAGALEVERPEGRLAGYHGALDAGRDLAGVRAWWRDLDHLRLRGHSQPTLDAVERAIAVLVGPDAAAPVYDAEMKDVFIDMPRLGGRFALRELSDGYRGLIGLIADIARRAATLNPVYGPGLLDVIPGIVIIDEIDLHLHPQLQAEVLPRLRKTFPEVQFVMTTHSPLVLGSVRSNDEVLELMEDHSIVGDLKVEGRDPEQIVSVVMGAPLRPFRHEEILHRLYEAIDQRAFEEAEQILADLSQRWGELDPEIVRARTLLAWER